jgi:hypothetical protein
VKFQATILAAGKTATGIQVPEKVVESLGAGKRPPVAVTLNGYTYRSTVAPMGGKFLVGVSAEVRQAAGVKAGDKLEVTIELDTAPREVEVPADLRAALSKDAAARKFFEGLSYSHKPWYVLPITGAKQEETRKRRVLKAVEMLRAGRKP